MRTLVLRGVAALAVIGPDLAEAQPSLPSWTLREELRLDAESHDFPTIGNVAVSSAGRIAVYIPQDRQIRVFSPSGVEEYRFGRKGSGPGEFEQLLGLRFIGDTLWGYDLTHRRITLITPQGTLLRSVSTAGGAGVIGAVNPMFVRGSSITGTQVITKGEGTARKSESWVVRAIGDSIQPLFLIPSTTVSVNAEAAGRVRSYVVPFTARATSSTSSNGAFVSLVNTVAARGDRVELHVIARSIDGATRFERRIPFRATPVTARIRDSALATITKDDPVLGPNLEQQARPLVPAFMPVHRIVVTGEDGSVWIRTRSARAADETLILDARGTPVAWLTLPARTSIRAVNATHAWATQSDEDGLTSVVRYRIVR